MTVTTEEFWDVGGQDLNNLAFNIKTLGGRSGVPPKRGSNFAVPYRPGKLWRPKTPDERTLSLAMWVIGADEDGVVPPAGTDQRALFNENWRMLKRLFFTDNEQIALTKRWRESSGLLSATALAELNGTMEPTMLGRNGASFVVDLLLADPFFYGDTIITDPIAVGGSEVAENAGDYRVFKGTIRFNGPLTNPRLTNTSVAPDVYVQYTGVIAAAHYVELDVDLFTAYTDLGVNVIAGITHDGARRWMELALGSNTLELTASAGTGNATFTYEEPYF